ncbi:MAG: NUDIX domain-containing protein [Chloroflexota bacterium]|nr:MAG: NUDIX hydrolase [Chloroflexota bacterium]
MNQQTSPPDTPITLENVSVDVVIFTLRSRDLQVCLVRRDCAPFKDDWALPGGGVRVDEPLERAALRILHAKTGVRDLYLQQLFTFGDPGRDPRRRVISVTYFALISSERIATNHLDGDSETVGWHSVYALPRLAFDHAEIIQYALVRLRNKIQYSAAAFELMPEEFTLRELHDAYMVILNDYTLDKANFRKKIREANILEPASGYRETGGRPARLYRFRRDAQPEIKARRFFP